MPHSHTGLNIGTGEFNAVAGRDGGGGGGGGEGSNPAMGL